MSFLPNLYFFQGQKYTSFKVKNILLLAKIYFSDKVLLWVTHQLVTLTLHYITLHYIVTIPSATTGTMTVKSRQIANIIIMDEWVFQTKIFRLPVTYG